MAKNVTIDLCETILSKPDFDQAVKTAVAGVKALKPTYDWVGVYLLEGGPSAGSGSPGLPAPGTARVGLRPEGQAPSPGSGQGVLTLQDDHYRGQPTSHTRIPLDSGLCGASAVGQETLVIDDVHADPRYIACSLLVRSEIVVPIMAGERLVGVLDLDSDTPAAFGESDRRELEQVAAALAQAWQAQPGK